MTSRRLLFLFLIAVTPILGACEVAGELTVDLFREAFKDQCSKTIIGIGSEKATQCAALAAERKCANSWPELISSFETTCRFSGCPPSSCRNVAETGAATATDESASWFASPAPLAVWPAPVVAAPQRAALLAFFNAMGGPNWDDKTGWVGAPGTECDWFGVACDTGKATVVRLSFQDNNLEGTLPAQLTSLTGLQVLAIDEPLGVQPFPDVLTKLPSLQVLILRRSSFTGTVPKSIAKLVNLRVLEFEDQILDSPLPAELWALSELRVLDLVRLRSLQPFGGPLPPEVSKLKNLEALTLSGNAMTGAIPKEWSSLKNLQSLNLTNNGVTGKLPKQLSKLKKLVNLSLDANQIEGKLLPGLGSLRNLEILDLSFNQLTGNIPPSFNNLTRLRMLSLVGNRLSGPLPHLTGFNDLLSVSIGPAGHKGPFPASWLNLRQLTVLMLPQAGLTGPIPDLSLFSNLEEINLQDNAFTPGAVPAWATGNLPELRKIVLSGTNQTGAMPDLRIYKQQLTHLGLGRNAFNPGPSPDWLLEMTKLKFLDLEATNRTGPPPSWLGTAHVQSLDVIDLSDNPFTPGPVPEVPFIHPLSLDLGNTGRTGAIPVSFNKELFMRRLALNDNQLSGPLVLTSLPPNLQELDLSRNRFSGPLPEALGNETQLRGLRLSGNQFTGGVPATFTQLTDLFDGALEMPLFGDHVGLDLSFNSLTAGTEALAAFLASKQADGEALEDTQTVAPTGGKATALSANRIRVTWTPIAFQGPGQYRVEISTAPAGPFSLATIVSPKLADGVLVEGLASKTKYYFRVSTATAEHAGNPQAVVSPPGAVFSGTTL